MAQQMPQPISRQLGKETGPYTVRVKVTQGVKLMPHRHPEARTYTVILGVFYIGLGDDSTLTNRRPIRRVLIVLPGNTSHFHRAKSGEHSRKCRRSGR